MFWIVHASGQRVNRSTTSVYRYMYPLDGGSAQPSRGECDRKVAPRCDDGRCVLWRVGAVRRFGSIAWFLDPCSASNTAIWWDEHDALASMYSWLVVRLCLEQNDYRSPVNQDSVEYTDGRNMKNKIIGFQNWIKFHGRREAPKMVRAREMPILSYPSTDAVVVNELLR